jgi:hypothetical protein
MVVASGPPAFTGFIEVKAVPLHERYFNSQKWGRWLYEKGVDNGRPKKGIGRYQKFWVDWGSKTHPNVRFTFSVSPEKRMLKKYKTDSLSALPAPLLDFRALPMLLRRF